MSFAEIQLVELAANGLEFGPEFHTVLVKSEAGITQANQSRLDPIRKGNINMALLTPSELIALQRFFVYRGGMAQGFRLYAPNDNCSGAGTTPDYESVGLPASGTVVGGGTEYNVIKTYSDYGMASSYTRRICKIDFTRALTIRYTLSAGSVVTTQTITPESPYTGGAGGFPIYGYSADFTTVRVDYVNGVIRILNATVAAMSAVAITWNGYFHTPVRFMTDHANFSHDSTHGAWNNIPICEILPSELGIT